MAKAHGVKGILVTATDELLFGGLGVQEANPPNVQSFVLLLFEKMAQIRNGKELYQNLTIAK